MIRFIAAIAGLAVIAAALHATVAAAGGWKSPDAPMIAAVSALIAVGMAFATTLWRAHNKLGAVLLGLCVLSGEIYWLVLNADRELVARDLAAAPSIASRDQLKTALVRVAAAEAAKLSADTEITKQAALPGCKAGCVTLLTQAQTDAAKEVTAARAAAAAIKVIPTNTALATKLGVAPWHYDLVLATLRSLVVLGGSIAVSLSLHSAVATNPLITQTARSETPQPPAHHPAAAARSRRIPSPIPKRLPAPSAKPANPPPAADAATIRAQASKFAIEALRADPASTLSTPELVSAYLAWCNRTGQPVLPAKDVARELARLFAAAGRAIQNGRLPGVAIRSAA